MHAHATIIMCVAELHPCPSVGQVMRFQQSSQGADKALDRDLQLPPGRFPAARCAGRNGSISDTGSCQLSH